MTDREKAIASLRAMADFYGTHPDVPLPYFSEFYCAIAPQKVRPLARELRTFKKEYSGNDFYMVKSFGTIAVKFFTEREAVCKKIVVGVKEVPEMIISAKPEQFIPASEERIIPAYTEEITEWVCSDAALMEPEESTHDADKLAQFITRGAK